MHSCFYVTHAYNYSRLGFLVSRFHAKLNILSLSFTEFMQVFFTTLHFTHPWNCYIEFVLQYLE